MSKQNDLINLKAATIPQSEKSKDINNPEANRQAAETEVTQRPSKTPDKRA